MITFVRWYFFNSDLNHFLMLLLLVILKKIGLRLKKVWVNCTNFQDIVIILRVNLKRFILLLRKLCILSLCVILTADLFCCDKIHTYEGILLYFDTFLLHFFSYQLSSIFIIVSNITHFPSHFFLTFKATLFHFLYELLNITNWSQT